MQLGKSRRARRTVERHVLLWASGKVACGLAYPAFVRRLIRRACCLQYRYGRRKDGWPGDVCVCAPPVDGRVPLLTYTYVRGVLHDEVRAEWPSGRIHCDASAAVVFAAKH
jgi:hypothetical protein